MDKLTHNVQIAVIKVLTEIQKADNVVRDKEIDYLKDVMLSFGLCDENLSEVNDTSPSQAISIIKELPAENKNEIAKMMGRMIVVDEDINYNEVTLYNSFCESCGIKGSFNIEEYPEYSLSGYFTDPID